ncbi:MAG: NYN domain-containing protein [Candidatus Omnitrophica bacterium]|nr:NYN domain-containing protein [Candidatus Omnitrophota bacterium]
MHCPNFKNNESHCTSCHGNFIKHEEKETDVALSIKLIELFITHECDIAAIMTGDTDIAPAVKTTKKLFPHSQILFIFPAFRKNKSLLKLCPHSFAINSQQYAKHQFPNPYTLKNGKIIHKPDSW